MNRSASTSDRKIEILKSAAAAFRRRGYHGASVDEIASALGLSHAAIKHRLRKGVQAYRELLAALLPLSDASRRP